jgi:hypothetical protein
MRYFTLTARLASFVFLGSVGLAGSPGASPEAAGADQARAARDDRGLIRLAPGRVQFSMAANGAWRFFGVRGERSLIEKGGVVVFATKPEGDLVERARATDGGMRALLSADAIAPVSEGAHGGSRHPSLMPDDDNDGRIDEDPLDRVDNDGDGEVDEDFAAVGDEMVVAMYGTKGNAAVVVRQESCGWSLPHIDGMTASTIVVRNAGTRVLEGARVGVEIEASPGLEYEKAPRIETTGRGDERGTLIEQRVVLRDRERGLAVLFFAPRIEAARRVADAGATRPIEEEKRAIVTTWEINDDHSRVLAVSPGLGDLAPGASATIHVALVSLPPDDLKAARAMHAARRTVEGDGTSRLIPPPVSLTARAPESLDGAGATAPAVGADGLDPFWSMPGKLEEKLLTGSPNPFRDVVVIDYEVPSRAVDEDGVEHALGGAAVATSVKVYNVTGRLVATLVDAEHTPGSYQTQWSAQDEEGTVVASGVYYVRLQIAKRAVTMRMVQLK